MHSYITTQKSLAQRANTTPQHLTGIKNGTHGVSPELAIRLYHLTNIKPETWASGTRKKALKRSLNAFFRIQRNDLAEFIQAKERICPLNL